MPRDMFEYIAKWEKEQSEKIIQIKPELRKPAERIVPSKSKWIAPEFIPDTQRLPRKLQRSLNIFKDKLYIITTNEHKPCKIGVSYKPRNRLNQLQTSNWIKLKIFKSYIFDDDIAYMMEKIFHREWEKHKLLGEWFDMTAEETMNWIESYIESTNESGTL